MSPEKHARLVQFLQEELAIPSSDIALALRRQDKARGGLPMVLWQYGLITLTQLEQIFDWMDTAI